MFNHAQLLRGPILDDAEQLALSREQNAYQARQHRHALRAGIDRETLHNAVRRAEQNLLKDLVRHGPRRGLDPVGIEHVAHASADPPV